MRWSLLFVGQLHLRESVDGARFLTHTHRKHPQTGADDATDTGAHTFFVCFARSCLFQDHFTLCPLNNPADCAGACYAPDGQWDKGTLADAHTPRGEQRGNS
jgi:hypothetical protein